MKPLVISCTVLSALFAAACGGRTTAATQPTPKAFDPAASDQKSLKAIDDMIVALGGAEKWAAVKQLRWEFRYFMDGEMKTWVKHSWDMWNGRHRCDVVDMTTYVLPTAENKNPDPPKFSAAMYDLFKHGDSSGAATYGGKPVDASNKKKIKAKCYELWLEHAYQVSMLFKLKDPGVKLEYVGQVKDTEIKDVGTTCKPACDSIKVTFMPGVGKDTYWVHINTETKLPDFVERRAGTGRLAHVLSEWKEVGGLKFPTKFQNAGLSGEIMRISNIEIGKPDDTLYIPQVR